MSTTSPTTARRRLRSALALGTAVGIAAATLPAIAASAAETYDVPQDQYRLVAASSESDPWPAPPALDGTALAAFDGDFSTQWSTDYAESAPAPHWIVIDLQRSTSITAVDYAVRTGQNGAARDVQVRVTDDPAVAQQGPSAWADPVATATLEDSTANDQRQRVALAEPTTARYAMFEIMTTQRTTTPPVGSVGELFIVTDTAPVDPDAPADFPTETVGLGGVNVTIAAEFPQIAGYEIEGSTIAADLQEPRGWVVDGTERSGTTTLELESSRAVYTTVVDGIDLTITSVIEVTDAGAVEFAVTDLAGAADFSTLGIADNAFLSADGSTEGAELDRTVVSPVRDANADAYLPLTGETPVDARDVSAAYAFLTNGTVAGGVITNATVEATGGASWNNRLVTRIRGEERRATIGSNTWLVHPTAAVDERVTTFELPKVTVALALDENGDGSVDWQDAAIAQRSIVPVRPGGERVADRVVDRIPFNFASQATNPFELTLDNTIRIANSTDFLGQWVLEKGYGNEGHDSANSDYGGNYNERAGGLEGLNELVETGATLNADFSVHVNATEIYPQANSFDPAMLQRTTDPATAPYRPGWNWLDQSYYIDQRYDLGQGDVLDRFAQLREEVPALSGVYIDVYYSSGWVAEELADELHEMGFEIATEWGDKFVDNSVWAHWPNDLNYGGANNKGVNSVMVRFMQNGETDIWNDDPLLGGQRLVDAEGWTGNNDWNAFMRNIWDRSLPTKFLQHFELLQLEPGTRAALTGDVVVELDGGERVITLGEAEVLRGDSYLLPWQSLASAADSGSPLDADKLYSYSAADGSRTFDLTAAFAGVEQFDVYTLGDQGRSLVTTVTAEGGSLTIDGDAGVPYVVVPQGSTGPDSTAYGAASALADPGFNAGDLAAWNPTGSATIERTDIGDNVAVLGAAASSLSQTVTGLEPGTAYSFSANVEIAPDAPREAALTVSGDGLQAARSFSITPARNWMAADAKHDTYSQRASVRFVAPADGTVTVGVSAAAGAAAVTVDAARVMPDTSAAAAEGTAVSEDFEGNQPGWGPFYKGDAGGVTDPRTSIAHRNDPYTSVEWKNTAYPFGPGNPQDGQAIDTVLDGDRSLFVHTENPGLVFRTAPSSVDFTDGHAYRVEFDYQNVAAGGYEWVMGADAADGEYASQVRSRTAIDTAHTTASFSQEFVAGCGSSWVGLQRVATVSSEMSIDNVVITDLGPDEAGAACATLDAGSAVLNPGSATQLSTTFTNGEAGAVSNVGVSLQAPEGWLVEVLDGSDNVFETVEPDASVTTTWLVTAPAAAAGTAADLTLSAAYLDDCSVKSALERTISATVSERSRVPSSLLTASASSEEQAAGPSEGPAALAIDGDPTTIWHSRWSTDAATYPHWLMLELAEPAQLEGIGYLRRSSNRNGPIKDYQVEVSSDGETWTTVATGAFENVAEMQDVAFEPVEASFVRLNALSSISGTQFAAIAELAVYGTVDSDASGHEPEERAEDDLSACGQTAVENFAGTDRYETNVRASEALFGPGTDVIIASGQLFPDALAAGPAAARSESSLLLTPGDRLLPVTVAELQRLQPRTVTIVGDTPSVSRAAEAQIAEAVPDATVRRIAGADRYDTAASIAEQYFGEAEDVLLTSGQRFADAVSASGLASAVGDLPVLLTPRDAVSDFTLGALASLSVETATVLGDDVSVADATVRAYRAAGLTVTRIAGADRYATNALLVERFIVPSDEQTIAVAAGTNFPDALSASMVAGARNAPVVLSLSSCVTPDTEELIKFLAPSTVVNVGGPPTLSPDAWRTGC